MVADKFRSIFSKKKEKDKESDEQLVQELHDILEGLEDARAEQLILSSMAREKKEEGESPVSVEEEKEAVEISNELESLESRKREEKKHEERSQPMLPLQASADNKSAREVKVDKQALATSYIMGTISVLFEAFKSEFLEYIVSKSLIDQKTREILFRSLEKLDKRDLVEIVRIIYKIVDEKLGTGLRVPEVTITSVSSSSTVQQSQSREEKRMEQLNVEASGQPAESRPSRPQSVDKEKGREEEVDLSSLLGEL